MSKNVEVPPFSAIVILGFDMDFFKYEAGKEPKEKGKLPAGSYIFKRVENPSGGTGDFWFETLYEGMLYGLGEKYLLRQIELSDGRITIKEIKKPPQDLTHQIEL